MKTNDNTKCRFGRSGPTDSYPLQEGCKWNSNFRKKVWQFLIKWKIHLLRDPAVTLLYTHPQEMKTYFHTKKCAWIFIIPRDWKQSKCLSTSERVNKMCYIQRNNTQKLEEYILCARIPNEGLTCCVFCCRCCIASRYLHSFGGFNITYLFMF